jgi:hypothetical protein
MAAAPNNKDDKKAAFIDMATLLQIRIMSIAYANTAPCANSRTGIRRRIMCPSNDVVKIKAGVPMNADLSRSDGR